jgi:hypothetical protein
MLPMFFAFALMGTNQFGAVIATCSAAVGFVIIALTVRSGISRKENIELENENFNASALLAK